MQKILKTPAVSRAAVAWAFKIACACAHTSIQDFAATINYKGSNLSRLSIFLRRSARYSGSCFILLNFLSCSSWGDAFCYCLKHMFRYFICCVFWIAFSILAKAGLCIDKSSSHTWSTGFSPLRTSGSMGGRKTCSLSSPSLSQMLDKTRKKLRERERKSVWCVCNQRATYICVCLQTPTCKVLSRAT